MPSEHIVLGRTLIFFWKKYEDPYLVASLGGSLSDNPPGLLGGFYLDKKRFITMDCDYICLLGIPIRYSSLHSSTK